VGGRIPYTCLLAPTGAEKEEAETVSKNSNITTTDWATQTVLIKARQLGVSRLVGEEVRKVLSTHDNRSHVALLALRQHEEEWCKMHRDVRKRT
jgi:2-methylaconitate cis-trans-isomerase PrpF